MVARAEGLKTRDLEHSALPAHRAHLCTLNAKRRARDGTRAPAEGGDDLKG